MKMNQDTFTIWHNPRCSKSRATLALLRENGVEPEIVEYLEQPPDAAEIERVLDLLQVGPRELMRRNEAPYAENGLDDEALDRGELVRAMVEHPVLIQRPVVIRGQRAVVGRPPENVLSLLR